LIGIRRILFGTDYSIADVNIAVKGNKQAYPSTHGVFVFYKADIEYRWLIFHIILKSDLTTFIANAYTDPLLPFAILSRHKVSFLQPAFNMRKEGVSVLCRLAENSWGHDVH
jgi:hypothetical protein